MSPNRRVVVTGVNGFVGRHLAAHLASFGDEVIGVAHDDAPAADVARTLHDFHGVDLTSGWPGLGPVDAIIHLAGLSAVGPSFDRPQHYLETNSSMLTHLGESLLAAGQNPRVVVVSSGAVYASDQQLPLTEDSRVLDSSPYVVSKLLVEAQAAYYRHRGLDMIVARPFNHIGPGQGPGFLVPDLVAALATQAATGTPLTVGNLTTARDYTDVRDVCRAYRLLAHADHLDHHLFNVCSGEATSGSEVLDTILRIAGMTNTEIVVDPSRLRPGDPKNLRGTAARLQQAVGWSPEISIGQSIAEFMAHGSTR